MSGDYYTQVSFVRTVCGLERIIYVVLVWLISHTNLLRLSIESALSNCIASVT